MAFLQNLELLELGFQFSIAWFGHETIIREDHHGNSKLLRFGDLLAHGSRFGVIGKLHINIIHILLLEKCVGSTTIAAPVFTIDSNLGLRRHADTGHLGSFDECRGATKCYLRTNSVIINEQRGASRGFTEDSWCGDK